MFDRVLNRPLIKLFKVNDKKKSVVVVLDQIIFELLIFLLLFLAVKFLGNCVAVRKLLHYVLDMPNISEQLINN